MQHFNHWRIPGLLSFCLGSVACVVPIELLETETETGTETQGDSTTHDDAGSGTGTDTSADTGAVGDTDTDTDTDAEPEDRLIALGFSAGGTMEVLSASPVTAATSVLGQMGNLGPWQNQAALSPDDTALYALGFPTDVGINGSLYVFDLSTDTFDYDVAHGGGLDDATLAGFDHQDRLIAMRFSAGGAMEVLSVDPVTAAIGVLGQMGSLGPWQNQAALSPDGTAVYALGFPAEV
nr:hypothetical protein [Deltaproteobacteria bacterium]